MVRDMARGMVKLLPRRGSNKRIKANYTRLTLPLLWRESGRGLIPLRRAGVRSYPFGEGWGEISFNGLLLSFQPLEVRLLTVRSPPFNGLLFLVPSAASHVRASMGFPSAFWIYFIFCLVIPNKILIFVHISTIREANTCVWAWRSLHGRIILTAHENTEELTNVQGEL